MMTAIPGAVRVDARPIAPKSVLPLPCNPASATHSRWVAERPRSLGVSIVAADAKDATQARSYAPRATYASAPASDTAACSLGGSPYDIDAEVSSQSVSVTSSSALCRRTISRSCRAYAFQSTRRKSSPGT
jgi:hypothetical protein